MAKAKVKVVPPELIAVLDQKGVGYTVLKGDIYYHSAEYYNHGQKIIDSLEKQLPKQGYNKFGNKKVKLMLEIEIAMGGLLSEMTKQREPITFDSEDEADYYFCLKDDQDAGHITRIELHPRLELFPKFTDDQGARQVPMIYTPDFYVEYADGRKEYVDVKGFSTTDGDMRRKLYNYLAFGDSPFKRPFDGVPLRWVASSNKYGDENGWIDYDELQRIRAKNRKEKKGA